MDNLFFQENLFSSEKIYTVLELNEQVREVVRQGFPQAIWVCGEIQNLRAQSAKNHIYFSLVQKDPHSDNIIAQVEANLFAGSRPLIEKRIKEAKANFELKNDIEVKFLCEVDLYAPRGKYNITIKDIDPVYTLGKVAQNRLKIIEELRKRNLLDKNKAFSIPLVPLKIGLITAYDCAAYHDFINELKLSGFGFRVLAFNCHMQGKMVEPDVLRALDFFNTAEHKVDVVVITRGGGSTADLSYFDNKKIAEAIAFSGLPIVSALGHQIDFTITDMVANTSCKTPTKAAQFLVEKVQNVVSLLDCAQETICKRTEELFIGQRKDLHNITMRVETTSSRYFRYQREQLLEKKHTILGALKIIFAKNAEVLTQVSQNLQVSLQNVFKSAKDSLDNASVKLRLLDPKNTLKRGYSITLKAGKAVKNINNVSHGDILTTVLYEGNIISEVKEKERNNDQKAL